MQDTRHKQHTGLPDAGTDMEIFDNDKPKVATVLTL